MPVLSVSQQLQLIQWGHFPLPRYTSLNVHCSLLLGSLYNVHCILYNIIGTVSKTTGKSGQCTDHIAHWALHSAEKCKVHTWTCHPELVFHCKARKAFVGPAMHWNAQEVYFITSDEVASCSKTISHKESSILTNGTIVCGLWMCFAIERRLCRVDRQDLKTMI